MTGHEETPTGGSGDRRSVQPEGGAGASFPAPPSFHTDTYMWLRMIASKAENGINSGDFNAMCRKLIEIRDSALNEARRLESERRESDGE